MPRPASTSRRARAYAATQALVKSGALVRLPCQKCGAAKSDAHHEDYDHPELILWLCRRCHVEHHAAEDKGRRSKSLRTAESTGASTVVAANWAIRYRPRSEWALNRASMLARLAGRRAAEYLDWPDELTAGRGVERNGPR